MNAAEFYERYWQHATDPASECGQIVGERQTMLKAALSHLPPKARVLDSGCGNGVFTAFLQELGFDVVGIDISTTAVEHAKQQCPSIQFKVASLEGRLPFQNEEFDAVWCTEVLEHVFDVDKALTEIKRILRSGGKLVLTTPYHGLVKNLVISILAFNRHYDPRGPHIRFFSRRSLTLCLEQAGFGVERWAGVGRFWPVWMSHFVVARKLS